MARAQLRFCFDAGSRVCLWSSNPEARDRFGDAVASSDLPVSRSMMERIERAISWHDRSIDWDEPPAPSPWEAGECARFNAFVQDLLADLRSELGPDFEILDASAAPGRVDASVCTNVDAAMQRRTPANDA